jgi:hypothetical protein
MQLIFQSKAVYAVLIVPTINYWWLSFTFKMSRHAFKKLIVPEQRTLWPLDCKQYTFPSAARAMRHPEIFCGHDMEVLQKMMVMPRTIEKNHSLRYKT